MLCFSDGALARLAIAAGRVPRSRRRKWLADIARQIELGESARRLGASTLRTRRWRDRSRDGLVLLRVLVPEIDLVTMLVGCGALDANRADDPHALARAVERLLAKFCDTSRRDDSIADTIRAQLLLSSKRT